MIPGKVVRPQPDLRPGAALLACAAAILVSLAMLAPPRVGAAAADTAAALASSGGFAAPVALIPEIGLWADGLAEVGFLRKAGLAIWWDVQPGAPPGRVDWRRVTYRIRAAAADASGKVVGHEQALVEPMRFDGASERGGFPTVLHLKLAPGRYRVRLEAYALISAKAAGLDSVPRGTAVVDAVIPDITHGSAGWRTSDLYFFRSVRKWEPGSSPERSWYDWVIDPSVARGFGADTASAGYLGFEVMRSQEVVAGCATGPCRIVVTVSDAAGGIVAQELRPVPEAGSLRAYLIPLRGEGLAPGAYDARVEIYDGQALQATMHRGFRVLAPRG